MNTEKQRSFIICFAYYTIIIAICYVFFRHVIHYVMPFVIGFLIAFMLRPIVQSMSSWWNGHEKLISIITILIFYATIGSFCTLTAMKAFSFIESFVAGFPQLYQDHIEPFISHALSNVGTVWHQDDGATQRAIETFITSLNSSISSFITSFSQKLLSMFTNFASSLPSMIISFFFSILSSFFFVIDYPRILSFFTKQLPIRQREMLFQTRHYVSQTMTNLCIAYSKIMMLTFIQLTIGLYIIGVENAMVIAFVIAIFDILPVLGTGGIMIPWMIFAYVNTQSKLALGLLIVYLIVTIIRNILEPRIVGKQIGLHPLMMLLCMYLGAKLFGFLGLFILPMILLILQNLNQSGAIRLYK